MFMATELHSFSKVSSIVIKKKLQIIVESILGRHFQCILGRHFPLIEGQNEGKSTYFIACHYSHTSKVSCVKALLRNLGMVSNTRTLKKKAHAQKAMHSG